MRKLIILSLFMSLSAFVFQACHNDSNEKLSTDVVNNTKSAVGDIDKDSKANIFFPTQKHDFGKVIQGEKVTYNFKFINTGGADLLISSVSSSCGCTVGEFPKTPVKSGEHAFIEVQFDSRKRKGIQRKTVTVSSNSEPNKTTLRIQAEVVIPEEN